MFLLRSARRTQSGRAVCWPTEKRADFRGLAKEGNLAKGYLSQICKSLILIDQYGQIAQLIFHDEKAENVGGLCLAFLQVNKGCLRAFSTSYVVSFFILSLQYLVCILYLRNILIQTLNLHYIS